MDMRVLTLGTFDTIHAGHVGLFHQCRRLAGPDGEVVVAVNSDEFVEYYKGAPPLIPYESRAVVIANLNMVDLVVENNNHRDQANLIDEMMPDLIVVGQDWALKDYVGQLGITQEWLDTRDIQLCYVPRTGHWSSTGIKTTTNHRGAADNTPTPVR